MYVVSHIAKIIEAQPRIVQDAEIEMLLLDSRKIFAPTRSLFFALKGPRRNGLQFINTLYHLRVINFVISTSFDYSLYP